MGLFDYVYADYPLPDPLFQHCEFQTKDLEHGLHRYTINADGSLSVVNFSACISDRKQTEETKTIQFYKLNPIPGISWVEFSAEFIEGKLSGDICIVSLEKQKDTKK